MELFGEGPTAAVTSRVGRDRFDPDRLQGKTANDIRWLGTVAARHNEIICKAAASSPVLPLRLGTLFCSPISLLAVLRAARPPSPTSWNDLAIVKIGRKTLSGKAAA